MNLGTFARDLTGDGKLEILRLVGSGPTFDSLGVTFTIESEGQILFQIQMAPLTRVGGFDVGRRRLTEAEYRARLNDFPKSFFAEIKFLSPRDFVERLRGSAPLHISRITEVIARDRRKQLVVDSLLSIGLRRPEAERRAAASRPSLIGDDSLHAAATWQEIQRTGVTVFEFSPGGDAIYPIAWSTRERRFYRLVECC